jgi:hypothetical protein
MPAKYYGLYLESILAATPEQRQAMAKPADWYERMQMVVIQPLVPDDPFAVHYRFTAYPTQRPTWEHTKRGTVEGTSSLVEVFFGGLTPMSAVRVNWETQSDRVVVRPPIVVGLTYKEATEYQTKTPWEVLNRAGRVAKKRHRFTI